MNAMAEKAAAGEAGEAAESGKKADWLSSPPLLPPSPPLPRGWASAKALGADHLQSRVAMMRPATLWIFLQLPNPLVQSRVLLIWSGHDSYSFQLVCIASQRARRITPWRTRP